MEKILDLMRKRLAILQKTIDKVRKDITKYPEGRLRISTYKNRTRYYIVKESGDTIGEYVKKSQRDIVPKLAMREYKQQFLFDAECEVSRLKQSIAQLEGVNADQTYMKLSPQRRNLITPYILTDDLYAKKWQECQVKYNPFMPEKLIYETKRGDKVRSKSEAIIADILFELKIPYFYERRLSLRNGSIRYPDFTLLRVKTREEVYLEHFGLLDDEEYLYKNLQKLDEYRDNGIYPGKNLIFTYETGDNPLDIRGIRAMLKDIFI